MRARYRYRIEPDSVQRGVLARTFGCARVVFNDVIRCQDEAFRSGVKLVQDAHRAHRNFFDR